MSPSIVPFGSWPSPISAVVAASGAVRLGGLCLDGADIYWVEGRPAEQGRNVVVRRHPDGSIQDLTPASFNVRSRVHEYGGGAFTVREGVAFFVNDGDQRVWRQDENAAPRPLTPEGSARHADLHVDPARPRLICVREDHAAGREPRNTLVSIPLAGGDAQVLADGFDFYASPSFSPDGTRLAYLTWSHPRMPWHGTELWVANVAADGSLALPQKIAGGPREAIFQPTWSPAGVLHFVSDRTGWWNLYRSRGDAIEPVHPIEGELGLAMWVFDLSTHGWLDSQRLACAVQREGLWRLGVLDTDSGRLDFVDAPITEISYLRAAEGRAVFIGASATEPAAIWSVAAPREAPPALTRLHRPGAPPVDARSLSRPRSITFPTTDGTHAYGLYYPPHNPDAAAPDGERPPLIVVSHGGPTAAASSSLNLAFQFWTSRGFAVLDVNYRGSTGYGRDFRDALDGNWGVSDVADCAAGARFLVAQGLADPARLAIRGGSAGGYTTLAALVFTDVFRAGASYYGVSDLEALARDTHKFESRYLDHLIGPYPARRDLYQARSPIHHVDRLSCPVIFFQGLEDKVVPPDQAERMASALQAKGLFTECVLFPHEQHGFRRAETIVKALESELAFYVRVFSLPPAR